MNKRFTCVDLFSGAGGLSKGFLDAGYNVVLGVDFDDAALKTFKENHGDAQAMKIDLFDHSNIDIIVDYLSQNDIPVDVLVGGPPCQGFSYAGPMDINDKRNFLYLAMVKLTERLKPQAVLIENVLGMLEARGGEGAKRIVKDFEKIGYTMSVQLLYAPDYGVPQIRKRVFFVGLRDTKEKFVFPQPIFSPEEYITCKDAISDLPTLQTENGDIIRGESLPLCEFFNLEYPTIKFTDQSLLEGNILVKIPKIRPSFNEENIVVWDWENIDIHKESQGLSKETDSIQFRVIDTLKKQGGYDIVFDDDGPGEIADVVCISANSNEIVIDLYHCKYSHGDAPGARVSDLYEVCGQAEKAVKWCQDYQGIIDRMCHRETERSLKRGSRIEVGDTQTLMKLRNMIRFYKVKLNMYILY